MPNRIPWYVVLVFPAIVIGAWWFTRDPKMELAVQPAPGMTLTETAAISANGDKPPMVADDPMPQPASPLPSSLHPALGRKAYGRAMHRARIAAERMASSHHPSR